MAALGIREASVYFGVWLDPQCLKSVDTCKRRPGLLAAGWRIIEPQELGSLSSSVNLSGQAVSEPTRPNWIVAASAAKKRYGIQVLDCLQFLFLSPAAGRAGPAFRIHRARDDDKYGLLSATLSSSRLICSAESRAQSGLKATTQS